MAGTQGPAGLRTAAQHHDRAIDREKHRAAAQLRVDADAARPAVPGGRCGPYRAADRRQGPQSRGVGRAHLSRPLVAYYEKQDDSLIRSYGDTALARVWKAERFSWWMTTLLHKLHPKASFEAQMQRAELDYLASSRAAQTVLAENYVGLPF